jgi:hypothetical protein
MHVSFVAKVTEAGGATVLAGATRAGRAVFR